MWKCYDSQKGSASRNMRLDEELLLKLDPVGSPILHFYDWEEKSATYGYFVDPSLHINLAKAKEHGLELSKRPTGGGITFHLWDLAFSVLIPAEHPGYFDDVMQNYAFVNNLVLKAIKEFLKEKQPLNLLPEDPVGLDRHVKHFCYAKPTKYDVMLGGKKVAGASQRKKRNGYLHQGSISLMEPSFSLLKELLLPGTEVLRAMKIHTFALLGPDADEKALVKGREELKGHLQKSFFAV